MKSRLHSLYEDFERALNALEEAVRVAKTDLEVEGAIKRFELCYELSWKLIKEALAFLGIVCKNPRECFKQAYQNGLVQKQEVWLRMIEDRNELVHVYSFEGSREIFERVRRDYSGLFRYLKDRVRAFLEESYE